MALVLQDRVKENSLSSGTGSVVLAGAYTGYRTFASCIPNGSTTYYCIHNLAPGYQDEWEVGLGTYTLGSTTLSRDTVLSSSAGGSKVNFTSGSGGLEVFITYPAEKAIFEQANGETIINAGPITVIGANVTTLPTLPAELGKFVGNVDLFAQIYNINQNSGQNASADFVVYNSDTDVNGTTFFADMGINSPNYSSVDYPIFTPNSGYFFSYGDGGSNTSTLFLGSGDGDVRIFAGGLDTNNTAVTIGTDLKTTLAGALNVATTLNVAGVTNFGTYAYSGANVASAANNTVLVTKAYVDDVVSAGVHFHEPVIYATAAVLPNSPTYNNGTAGVGATLTAGSNVALTIDGVTLTSPTDNGIRVLVQNQASATQNGIYVVTEAGSGSAPWQLTRSSDADTYEVASSDGLSEGSTFYVEAGTANAGSTFTCNTQGTITFGTTAITFALVSSALTYTGGTNINVSGLTISLTGTVAATNGGTGQNTTTVGDLLYGTSSNTWSKLALGAANRSLIVNGSGTQVEWNAVPLGASGAVSGSLPAINGGTGQTTYTTGDTLYSSAANTLAKLAGNTSTTRRFLSQTGNGTTAGAPAWNQPAASDITGLAASATTDTTNASNISSGTLANARTTASSSNGASTIVARDASGNFAANTITANVTGNISGSAATLTTARNFQISGGATAANVSFNGSAAVNLNVTAMNASVINSGTIPNANTTASSSNGASTIVARDASGNFTAANVTATNFIGTLNGSGANVTTLNASNISTGTLANARTTASDANGASTIVARDASGNFTGNTITAVTGFSGSGASLTSLNATALSSGTIASARVSGSYTGITGVGTLTAGTWNASAITDTYLATITTAGKVANSATTATASNGASTIIARDANGSFSANVGTFTTITGAGSGITNLNASSITTGTLDNARTTAASANGASTIVARDASGNFTANTGTFTTITGAGSGVTSLNASNLASGTVPDARFPATLPAISGTNLTNLNATALTSGTVPDARFPATLPAVSGANLTSLNASSLASGTVPDARFPATLPAVSGTNLTNLNASSISSGTVGTARLASGTANNTTYLRGDSTWAALSAPNNGTLTLNTSGTGLSGSATFTADQAGNTTFTVDSNASSSNGASTIVARDASGNFTANVGTFTTITGAGGSITAINASNISSGTLDNARTTAASANGSSTIIARDASGNFTANTGTFTTVTGAGSGITSLNASALASGTAPVARLAATGTPSSSTFLRGDSAWVALSAPNNGTLTMNVSGTGLSGSATFTADQAGNSTFTVTSNASSSNGASTIVARDASGNFSANTITANLVGNASTATSATSATSATTATQVSNALTAGTGITYSSGTTYNGSAAITISIPQDVGTASNVQFGSFGVGTAASGTTGEIRATNNVTAFFSSDAKFKENVRTIDGALDKVTAIGGKYFDWTDEYVNSKGGEDGYFVQKADFGVIAQDVQAVFPHAVRTRPDGSLAVDYEKLSALAFAAIVELKAEIDKLKGQ